MSLRLRVVPDPVLRQRAEPVAAFDRELASLADEMTRLMLIHRGIGLAAPQVGVLRRLVIVLLEDGPHPIVNPVLVHARGDSVLQEGCLSCPGVQVAVRRRARVLVDGRRLDGSHVSYRFDKLSAHCIQHEIDHLDGRLILDHGPAIAEQVPAYGL